MHAHAVVQFQNLGRFDPERGPTFVIDVVVVRNDGIQTVITAIELEHDQDRRIATGLRGRGRLPPQSRSRRAQRRSLRIGS